MNRHTHTHESTKWKIKPKFNGYHWNLHKLNCITEISSIPNENGILRCLRAIYQPQMNSSIHSIHLHIHLVVYLHLIPIVSTIFFLQINFDNAFNCIVNFSVLLLNQEKKVLLCPFPNETQILSNYIVGTSFFSSICWIRGTNNVSNKSTLFHSH